MSNDVAEIIARIERLVADGADVDQFIDHVHGLVSVSPVSLGSTYQPGTPLYRATKHHRSVPGAVKDLWHPPVEKAALSRANRKGEPIFYCSSDPNCAFREIGASVGQLVVHAKWVTTAPMLLHDLGYTAQVFARAGSRRELPERHRTFYESTLDQKGRTVRDYLALAFTEPTSIKYALTTAIAEVHLRADEFSGLLYPAVSKATNVDNLALRPEFLRGGLRLETAQLVRIDQVTGDGSTEGEIICDLKDVSADGTLNWSFRQVGTSVPPGGAHAVRIGDRIRVQTPGEIQVEGKRYRVDTGFLLQIIESGVIVRDLQGGIVEPLQ
jgi:hypothetical protein